FGSFERGARAKERGELVAELIAHRAKAKAKDVLQVRLERERVPRDAVEAELVLEALSHLLGRARKDVDARAGADHLAQERRRAGVRALLVGALERGLHEIADRVELGPQIRFVE